jgi:hypothetical protein
LSSDFVKSVGPLFAALASAAECRECCADNRPDVSILWITRWSRIIFLFALHAQVKDRQTDRQTDRQADRQTDREKDRQADRQISMTCTDTHICIYHCIASSLRLVVVVLINICTCMRIETDKQTARPPAGRHCRLRHRVCLPFEDFLFHGICSDHAVDIDRLLLPNSVRSGLSLRCAEE